MKKINKFLLAAGLVAAANAVIATLLSNITLGTLLTWALAAVLLICSFRSKGALRVIKSVILGGFCLLLAGGAALYISGSFDTADFHEDAVIVLGTGVRGEEPTASLKKRLDATLEYLESNPDALIVVTGGQGSDENITEALCMERYLLARGIPQKQIIKEDRATSTEENFKFSRDILDDLLSPDQSSYKVCYISNDFHIFRAGIYARQFGFEDAAHYSGTTPWYMIVPNGLREAVVVCKTFVLG